MRALTIEFMDLSPRGHSCLRCAAPELTDFAVLCLLAVSDTIKSVMLPRNELVELVLLPLRACRSLAVPYLRR